MRNIKQFSVLVLAFMLTAAAGCAPEYGAVLPDTIKSQDDSGWLVSDGNTIILDNDTVMLEMDPATTHFVITDKRNGKTYPSVPPEETPAFSEEDKNRLRSELTVTYYEKQSNAEYMYSGRDSVDQETFEIRYNDKSIRVYYYLGAAEIKSVVPEIFSETDFNSRVIASVDDPNVKRRLLRFYSLYASEKDSPDDYDEKLEIYPVLKNTPLYILNSDVSDVEREEISLIMEEIGYQEDEYISALDELGIENGSEKGAGFTVPIEYALTKDGFSATVLSDKILESSSEYVLQKIEILEYFGASVISTEEKYVIPDGSGSLIDINGSHKTMYSQNFYGGDYSANEPDKVQLTQNLMLPVYGISGTDYGIFTILETASEVATLNISPISNSAPMNHIFVSFDMRFMDVTDIGKNMQVPIYNLFSNHIINASPKIRYVLLEKGRSDYSSMAEYYREYLIGNAVLNESNADISALDIEFLCMIIEKKNAIGISYDSKTVLSTLSEIIAIIRELQDSGVGPINVRLKGYGNGGLSNKAANRFSVDSDVGTIEELESLRRLLEKEGGKLWLDADFQFVYTSGNGFSNKNDAAHHINRTIVCGGDYDIVTREYDNSRLFKYFVSPYVYQEFADAFLSDLEKTVGNKNLYGISYGTSGKYLGGDYASRDIDRVQSRQYLDIALEKAENSLMFDNGNGYILKYAGRILQVPSESSNFDMEERSIPFYQMVIHGFVPYGGISQNISRDKENALLKSAEYGFAIGRTWITGDNSLLTNTEYELDYYSVNAASGIESLLEDYGRIRKIYELTYNSVIKSHELVSSGIYRTNYENGISVLVNYGNEPAEIDGITVNAKDFIWIGEE